MLNRRFLLAALAASALVPAATLGATVKPAPKAKSKAAPAADDDSGHEWKNWGAAPYASNPANLRRKAPEGIRGFRQMPEPVKQLFLAKVDSDPTTWEKVYLPPEMQLKEMWSGPDRTHSADWPMQDIPVAAVPVTRSADGRTMRGVFQTAQAYRLKVFWEGNVYYLYAPEVCFNLSWNTEEGHCAELGFHVLPGTVVRFAVGSLDGPFPPNDCAGLKQGDGDWEQWSGQCDSCDWSNIEFLRTTVMHNPGYAFYHMTKYVTTARDQTLRFPRSVWDKVVALCLEYTDPDTGVVWQATTLYVRPEDWKRQWRFDIPDDKWDWKPLPATPKR